MITLCRKFCPEDLIEIRKVGMLLELPDTIDKMRVT